MERVWHRSTRPWDAHGVESVAAHPPGCSFPRPASTLWPTPGGAGCRANVHLVARALPVGRATCSSQARGGRISRGPGGLVVQEAHREAHLSAQQPSARQAPRVPAPDVDPGRPSGAAFAPSQGTPSAVGLTWRVRDRRTFIEMRRAGLRARSSLLSVNFLAEPRSDAPPRLAFAVSKKAGNAVQRNLLRRRLRAAFQILVADPEVHVPSGAFLLSARSNALTSTFEELTMELRQLVRRLETLAARRTATATDG